MSNYFDKHGDKREDCSCGDKIFNESQKAMVKVTRLELSKQQTSVFNTQTFPVRVISCSKRCFLNQVSEKTNKKYLEN